MFLRNPAQPRRRSVIWSGCHLNKRKINCCTSVECTCLDDCSASAQLPNKAMTHIAVFCSNSLWYGCWKVSINYSVKKAKKQQSKSIENGNPDLQRAVSLKSIYIPLVFDAKSQRNRFRWELCEFSSAKCWRAKTTNLIRLHNALKHFK